MNTTAEQAKAYEAFKLQWMLNHGYTLENLISELEKLRAESDPDMTLQALFKDWEFGYGFGSEIWPCIGEFLDCEGRDFNDEYFCMVGWRDEDIASKLAEMGIEPTDDNVNEVRCRCINDHHFTDSMIVAGWDEIENKIVEAGLSGKATDDYIVYDETVDVEIERDGEYMVVPFCEIRAEDYIIHVEKYAGEDAHESEDPDYAGWVVYDTDGNGIFPEDLGAGRKKNN